MYHLSWTAWLRDPPKTAWVYAPQNPLLSWISACKYMHTAMERPSLGLNVPTAKRDDPSYRTCDLTFSSQWHYHIFTERSCSLKILCHKTFSRRLTWMDIHNYFQDCWGCAGRKMCPKRSLNEVIIISTVLAMFLSSLTRVEINYALNRQTSNSSRVKCSKPVSLSTQCKSTRTKNACSQTGPKRRPREIQSISGVSYFSQPVTSKLKRTS